MTTTPDPTDIDTLAQVIRKVDGAHGLGPKALAKTILAEWTPARPEPAKPRKTPTPRHPAQYVDWIGDREAWEWIDGTRIGVAIAMPGNHDLVAAVELTPDQMRELARRLLNAAHDTDVKLTYQARKAAD